MSRASILALALLAGTATSASAQGWIEIERPPIRVVNPGQVIRTSSRVRTTLEGRVAHVEVEEQFRNAGGGIAEGSYLYPLPGEAVFQNFSLWIGEQEVRGEMMNAEQARGIYEEIVRRLKDPALLTLAGHGLVRAQVFPIQPGETRKVVLRYTQLLDRSGDALRLKYAIGQRDDGRPRGWGDRPAENRGASSFSYGVTIPNGGDFGTPYSPTHQLNTRTDHGRLELTLDPDAAGDVEIFLPLRHGLVGTSFVAHAPGGEDGYFMLLLAPAQADDDDVVPRDLSLVVDVSGSMSGDKLDQAKAALTQALGSLRPGDRFRLVAFSSGVRNFRDGWSPATAEALGLAREWVNRLQADGGTNIAGALDAVLGSSVAEGRLPLILFLTDGIPSVGEQAPDRIAERASGRIGRARIFTVGIGHDVNTYLLDRLAKEGRGSAEYVAPDANVEVAVGALLGKLQRPALVNLRITNSPVELLQQYPTQLPDLFYGEELVVFGRYHGRGEGPVVIQGERNGRREEFRVAAAFPASEDGNDFIPRLWASRRIGDLTRQIRLDGGNAELVNQVRDLGLKYGILTEYSSYLVQEPGVALGGLRMNDQVAAAAPAPAAQTGREAFERAKASAAYADASNLASADVEADEQLNNASRRAGTESKRVGGRMFVRQGTLWSDAARRDGATVVEVAPFSDGYFALVRALPEIAPYLSVGDEVLVAGKAVSIKITQTGAKSLSRTQLEDIVRQFRGR